MNNQIVRVLVVAVFLSMAVVAGASDPPNIREPQNVNGTWFLQQEWTDAQRHQFYFTPQGSQLMPYSWLQALEMSDSSALFLPATDTLSRYGYLKEPSDSPSQQPDQLNPDRLPIGFVKDSPSKTGVDCQFVGMTCAACHTARIRYKEEDMFVDGAPAFANMYAMIRDLRDALAATAHDEAKLARFREQLPPEEKEGGRCLAQHGQQTLAESVQRKSDELTGLLAPDGDETKSAGWGPARIDAVGMIINQIFSHLRQNEKRGPVDAPVSYPFLWDTHQHNQVQWNGVSELPLVRNTVQVLGVFTDFGPETVSFGPWKHYESTVRVSGLLSLQQQVKTLRSPEWPEQIFKIGIDSKLRDQGKELFFAKSTSTRRRCADCHSQVARDQPVPNIQAVMTPVSDIGTDPNMAVNFANADTGERKIDCSQRLENPAMEVELGKQAPLILGGLLNTIRLVLREKLRSVFCLPPVDKNRCAYKGRPLDGIWATAPYLHNGSVPNLDELLKPADQRVKKFCVATFQKFDPIKVGLPSQEGTVQCPEGEFLFDTTLNGNKNSGHEYGVFTDAERRALIEYQKSL